MCLHTVVSSFWGPLQANDNSFICSSEFVVWRTNNKAIKNFLYMVAKDSRFINYCIRSAAGTSNSHKRVNPRVMMKYKIAYNRDVAINIGASLEPILQMLVKNNLQTGTLIDLRDWLMPMLMNGQITVEEAEGISHSDPIAPQTSLDYPVSL
jgi:type I restriction enzyme S subunit